MIYIYCTPPEKKSSGATQEYPIDKILKGQNEISAPACEELTFSYDFSSNDKYTVKTKVNGEAGAPFGFHPLSKTNPFLDLSNIGAINGSNDNSRHTKMPPPEKDYRIIHFNTVVNSKVEEGKVYTGENDTSPLYWVGVNLMNLSDSPEKIAEKFTNELNSKKREPNARIGIIFYYSAPQTGAYNDKIAAMRAVIVKKLKGSVTLQAYNTFDVNNETWAKTISIGIRTLSKALPVLTCPGNENHKGKTFTFYPGKDDLDRSFSEFNVDKKCLQESKETLVQAIHDFGVAMIRKEILAANGLIFPFYIIDTNLGYLSVDMPKWDEVIKDFRCDINDKNEEECKVMIDGYNILMKII